MKEIRLYGNTKGATINAIQHDGNYSLEKHLKADEWQDVDIEIIIRPIYDKHSRAADGYYRAVVLPIATQALNDATGEEFSEAQIHVLFKNLYNAGNSTADLDTPAFIKFTRDITGMLSEHFKVHVPDPLKISNVKTKLRL